jgi:hypothetical protein
MISIGIRNLFLYAGEPLLLPDDTKIVYFLDGTWQVREWNPTPCFYVGRLIFETPAAIEMAAWLNQQQVRGEHAPRPTPESGE